jgi:hypothetical protein
VQLATRIPKPLHRAVKLECVASGELLREWVRDALEAHLRRIKRKSGKDDDESGPGRPKATLLTQTPGAA